MLFRELKELGTKRWEERRFLVQMSELGVNAPWEAVLQFYFDHRNNSDFLHQYGHIDILKLRWQTEVWEARRIVGVSVYERFQEWVDAVRKRATQVRGEDYSTLDIRDEVVACWKARGTWQIPPIIMDGALVAPRRDGFHLVEGHTRLGCLAGLVDMGVISPESTHRVLLGCYA